MDGETQINNADLAAKIARLVQERGWNQEDFARISNLNRHTVRTILQPGETRKLRNATVSACANALSLTVNELRHWPLERLLPRMNNQHSGSEADAQLRRLYERATQPELVSWIERNPERGRQLSNDEIDELLSMQGSGGALTSVGVEHYVNLIERKRRLKQQVDVIANSELIDVLEKLVELMCDKLQPYRDRT